MEIEIQMTGREDREGPWKIGLAGHPGSGKTLFGSTAPDVLFVFFQEKPPIKSIANRFVAKAHLVNKFHPDGTLGDTVQDQMKLLIASLQAQHMTGDLKYKTIVLDTGDELFQALAAGRRAKNRGEFGPGDWTWLADAFRSIVQSVIDLPMNVVVMFHVSSSQDGETGFLVRELSLQGSSKPEAPGWFDVMGALDSFETVDEEGNAVTRRVILTHGSRLYPWLKDHSGNMPPRFELSANFVGDFERLLGILTSTDNFTEGQERQILDTIEGGTPVTKSGAAVPKPEDLKAKKAERTPEPLLPVEDPSPEQANIVPEADPVDSGIGGDSSSLEPDPAQQDEPLVEESTEPGDSPEATVSEADPEGPATAEEAATSSVVLSDAASVDPAHDDGPSGEEPSDAEILEVTAPLEAEFVCAECQIPVPDPDLRQISQLRYRKHLCRPHFRDALAQERKG